MEGHNLSGTGRRQKGRGVQRQSHLEINWNFAKIALNFGGKNNLIKFQQVELFLCVKFVLRFADDWPFSRRLTFPIMASILISAEYDIEPYQNCINDENLSELNRSRLRENLIYVMSYTSSKILYLYYIFLSKFYNFLQEPFLRWCPHVYLKNSGSYYLLFFSKIFLSHNDLLISNDIML